MPECLVIGDGIVGLSIAAELAEHGWVVTVIGRDAPGGSASWAAAGILPPPALRAGHDGLEQLRTLSHRLYTGWCSRLAESTGIDPELSRCGGLYVARQIGEAVALEAAAEQWRADDVQVQRLDPADWGRLEPSMPCPASLRALYHLPGEVLVRPPRLLQALRRWCDQLGVTRQQDPWHRWDGVRGAGSASRPGDLVVRTVSGRILAADHYVVAAGPWSAELVRPFGVDLPLEPRRGQILMWQLETPRLRHVINEGPRYLLNRADGCLLVGSTVEDVGFDNRPTETGKAQLQRFAAAFLPDLADRPPNRAWSGLRPAALDGLPYLGPVPGQPRVFLASGHYRSGIHLAPATARVVRQWLQQEPMDLDLLPFRVDR